MIASQSMGGQPVREISPVRKCLYSLLIMTVIFGLPELLLRTFWSPRESASRDVGTRRFVTWLSELSVGANRGLELYRDDAELLWRLKPGATIDSFNYHRAQKGELQPIRITVNSEGYRGANVPPPKTSSDSIRVLCLGDSNFFGYPLDDAEVFPRALTEALQRAAPGRTVEVVNGGVPGYTVLQGRRLFERIFPKHQFDWLLLSYLNNDAWLQPQSDTTLFRLRVSWLGRISQWANHIYLVRFGRSLITRNETPAAQRVPRVSIEEFINGYKEFIAKARERRARVMIIDYRAYQEYEPYSIALRQLATAEGVGYLAVAPLALEAARRGLPAQPYAERAKRVLRRWGPAILGERPYLWYYAEYHPDHLNEVGTHWLADLIAPELRPSTRD